MNGNGGVWLRGWRWGLVGVVAFLGTESAWGEGLVPDRAARDGEVGYMPADGTIWQLDPPGFVWLPAKGAESYAVQWSRTPEFDKEVAGQTAGVKISMYTPPKTIGAGKWYWRYGAQAGPKTVWSKVRAFTIAEDAATLPLPPVAEWIERIPRSHPRLFVTADEVADLRARRNGDLKADWRRLVKACEKSIGETLIAEPEHVKGKGPARGKHFAEIIRRTRPPMDAMERCGLAYLLSGEKKYAAEAYRRLRCFFSWDPAGSTSLFRNDEPAMWMMMRGVRAYDWIYDTLTETQREPIEKVMRIRAAQFNKLLRRMPFESRPFSSHSGRIIGFLGESALCFAHDWPESQEYLDYIVNIYRTVFPAWGGDGGGWQEGPNYWNAYMSFALHFTTALKKASGYDLHKKPFFRNTPYYAIYTFPPYGKMTPFGDGQNAAVRRGHGDVLYQFSTLLQDPHARWYADALKSNGGASMLGIVLRDEELKAKGPGDLPPARLFAENGLVGMHSALGDPQEVYLVFRSSPYGSVSHGHAGQNGFAVQGFGEPLAIASGYYPWYGSLHHKNWTWETKSVNSITVDGGQGQTKRSWQSKGRIVGFKTEGKFDYVCGDATAAYRGSKGKPARLTKFLRHILHIRPGVFVVVDELEANVPRKFEWWLHALDEMRIDAPRRVVEVARKKARLNVVFLEPEKLTFAQTDQFDPPPERGGANQWHVTAGTEPAKAMRFVVLMTAHAAGDTAAIPEVRLDGNRLSLVRGAETFDLRVPPVDAVWRDAAGKVRQKFRAGNSLTPE